MTIAAVGMDFVLTVLIIGGIDLCLMVMAVMAKMFHGVGLLMLAIDGRHGPGHLQWQHGQQQNEEQAFH